MGLSSSSSCSWLANAMSVEMKALSDFGVRLRPNDETSTGFGVTGSGDSGTILCRLLFLGG